MRGLLAFFCAGLAFIWAQGAGAALTRAAIGKNSAGGGNSTVAITTTADCPAGSLLVVLTGAANDTSTASSVTDNATGGANTYGGLNTITSGAGVANMRAFHADNTAHDLPLGGTITVTWSSTSAPKLAAAECVGGAAASPLDVNATGTAFTTTTTPTQATGSLAQASEIIYGFELSQGGVFTSAGTGFTSAQSQVQNANTLATAFDIVSSTSTVTFGPTLTSSSSGVINVATFKAAASDRKSVV